MIHIEGVRDEMIANNLEPAFPTHPGEVVKMEIESRGITQRSLAAAMGISYSSLNDVLNEKKPVNAELALMFEATLGLDPQPLLTLQQDYNMYKARHNKSFLSKISCMRRVAAVF